MSWGDLGQIARAINKTAGVADVTAVASATAEPNSLLMIAIGTDNQTVGTGATSLVSGVFDSRNNQWIKVEEFTGGIGATAAGATFAHWYTSVRSQIVPGDTIRISLATDKTAKTLVVHNFSKTETGVSVAAVTALAMSTGATSGGLILDTLPNREYLFWGAGAAESTGVSGIAASGYTAFASVGTSGGTANTNITVIGSYRTQAATDNNYGYDVTGITGAGKAVVFAAFIEVTAGAAAAPTEPANVGVTFTLATMGSGR